MDVGHFEECHVEIDAFYIDRDSLLASFHKGPSYSVCGCTGFYLCNIQNRMTHSLGKTESF